MAINYKAKENISIQRFLNKLLSKQGVRKIEMLGDNKTSLTLTKNPNSSNRTKHIDVMYYDIEELVEDR